MRYCKKCVLSDNMFSVEIDEEGLCNYCKKKTMNYKVVNDDTNFRVKNENKDYDVLLAYSGGKDSTYTLYMLKEKYNLNVLTMTFDNGFLSDKTYKNIKCVTKNLDVDNIIIAPSVDKLLKIFDLSRRIKMSPKSLERASSICTYCIGLVKSYAYKEAIMRNIPLITFGWTPGQIAMNKQVVKLQHEMIKANVAMIRETVQKEFGEDYSRLFINDKFLEDNQHRIPSMFYPFSCETYDESKIIEIISTYGWQRPTDTDQNSTNCLLNIYGIEEHVKKYGFHPYAHELAGLVRNNLMSREEALARLSKPVDEKIFKEIEEIFSKIN